MKTLIKLLVLLVVVSMVITTFAACGSGNPSVEKSTTQASTNSTSKKPKEVVKLKISSVNRHDMEIRMKQVEEWNKAHPDIQVTYEVTADDYDSVMFPSLQAGNGPDILTLAYDRPVTSAFILPINQFLTDGLKKKFNMDNTLALNQSVNEKGEISGIPFYTVSFRLVYNKDLFKQAGLDPEKPPKTWADFEEYSKKISALSKDIGGMGWQTSDPGFTDWQFKNWMMADGYQYEWDLGAVKPSSAKVLDYAKTLKSIMKYDVQGYNTLNADKIRAIFAEGKIGMMIVSGSYDVAVYNDQFPAKCDWAVAPMPTFDGNRTRDIMHVFAQFGINKDTKYSDQAWDVYQNLLFGDNQVQELAEGGKFIFPWKLAKEPVVDKKNGSAWNTTGIEIGAPATPMVDEKGSKNTGTLVNDYLNGKLDDKGLQAELDKRIAALQAGFDEAVNAGKVDPAKYKNDKYVK